MTAWEYILGAVLVLISLVLIVIVLMQQSKAEGLSGAISGGSSDTFFGKHKGRTMEAKLEKLTKVLCSVFIILTLATTLLIGFLA